MPGGVTGMAYQGWQAQSNRPINARDLAEAAKWGG